MVAKIMIMWLPFSSLPDDVVVVVVVLLSCKLYHHVPVMPSSRPSRRVRRRPVAARHRSAGAGTPRRVGKQLPGGGSLLRLASCSERERAAGKWYEVGMDVRRWSGGGMFPRAFCGLHNDYLRSCTFPPHVSLDACYPPPSSRWLAVGAGCVQQPL